MKYFIADTHFSDGNILVYEHRPFKSVDDMNDTIVQNWNKIIRTDDEVYILGDIGNPTILSELAGNKIVVVGNHDNYTELLNTNAELYVSKYPIMVGPMWLSHEPITFMPPECPYVNIHGHTHRFSYGLTERTWRAGNRYFCVSVEQIGYTPISMDEIIAKLEYK